MVFLIILLVLILILFFTNVRIVPQAKAYVIERLGKYKTTWEAGLRVKMPLIDRVAKIVSLKEQVLDFPPQPVITKDNVVMQIDSVVFCKVFDPALFTYGVENPMSGLQNLSATTLRSIIGEMELDQTLTSREEINGKMQAVLDDATDQWGIKVTRVEIKNINPPREIEEVMTNYLSNAIHHADFEKKISVFYTRKEDCLRISVFNTGTPIPEEDLDKVWVKFFKVDKARTREYGGSGIGLSIVKAIMDSFQQQCGCQNYDNGVAFWFTLEADGKTEEA